MTGEQIKNKPIDIAGERATNILTMDIFSPTKLKYSRRRKLVLFRLTPSETTEFEKDSRNLEELVVSVLRYGVLANIRRRGKGEPHRKEQTR